jgi:hypothetical protein
VNFEEKLINEIVEGEEPTVLLCEKTDGENGIDFEMEILFMLVIFYF